MSYFVQKIRSVALTPQPHDYSIKSTSEPFKYTVKYSSRASTCGKRGANFLSCIQTAVSQSSLASCLAVTVSCACCLALVV